MEDLNLRDIKLRTLLIQLPYNKEFSPPSLGIPLLQGYLKEKGYKNLDILDLNYFYDSKINNKSTNKRSFKELLNNIFKKSYFYKKKIFEETSKKKVYENQMKKILQEIKQIILDKNPQLLGISVTYPSQIPYSLSIIKVIKQTKPSIFIALGGNQITRQIKELINQKELKTMIDAFIIGDGTKPLANLILHLSKKKNLNNVPNIYFKSAKHGSIFYKKSKSKYSYNPQNGLINPDFSGIKLKGVIPIQVSIGCPWGKCTFCTYNKDKEKNKFSKPKDVVKMIKNLVHRYKIKEFWFVDDSLNINFLKKFSKEILNENLKIKSTFYLCFHPQLKDEKFIRLISKAGCKKVVLGLESISKRILSLMNKPQSDYREIRLILKKLKKFRIHTTLMVMFGFPSETKEEAKKTLNFLIKERKLYSKVKIKQFVLEENSEILKNPQRFNINQINFNKKINEGRTGFYYKTNFGMSIDEAKKFTDLANSILKRLNKV